MVTSVDQDDLAAWHELLRACLEEDKGEPVFSSSLDFGWADSEEVHKFLLESSDTDWTNVRQLYICFMNLAEGFDF